MAPPGGAPSGYASPYYYAPAGATVPVHRTPWMLIIAGVVALVVLMAGCGTALAVLGKTSFSVSGGVGTADVPSPTPAGSPSPVASPTAVPTGPSSVSNDALTLTLPVGWTVLSKDSEEIAVADPNSEGEVDVASGSSSPAQTAQDNKNTIDSSLKSKYPDTRDCPSTKTTSTTFNGVKGISWTLCLTLTDGTHSVPAAASMFAGANSTGSVYYVVFVLTRQDDLTNYLTETKPVLATVHWKL